MSKRLHLSFLWHMHQPYYADDVTHTSLMPWVFLHAIKDYYDIPYYQSHYPKIKSTYNIVPSLMKQIEDLISGDIKDKLLELIKKETHHLSDEEREYLGRYLFLANHDHIIKPLPRYDELYHRYQRSATLDEFEPYEIMDLEVMFLLGWSGNKLREEPFIEQLIAQNSNFSQEQKIELLNLQFEFLKTILPFYQSLQQSGQISLSTTPYYHPILPLLIDFKSALDAKEGVEMPKTQNTLADFGGAEIERSIELFETKFHHKPKGFWPAEGSVSEAALKLLNAKSIQWCASDEEVLFKTIHTHERSTLYKNYRFHGVDIRFRDRYLSDKIGFVYSRQSPKEAVDDFVGHLRNIYEHNDNPLVNIILDGENAWEFYPQNGKPFFDELYARLSSLDWVNTIHHDDITTHPDIPKVELANLASGSWINGNFDIWIGNIEKNKAWEFIDEAKTLFEKTKSKLSPEIIAQVENEFMIASGSDWFWWYGDDHFTVQKGEFDALFRKHILNIYALLGAIAPLKVYNTILQRHEKPKIFHLKPKDYIAPNIDGKMGGYFEWLGAGFVDVKKEFSVMDTQNNIINGFYYGFDSYGSLYLSFEKHSSRCQELTFELRFAGNIFRFDASDNHKVSTYKLGEITIACEDRIEIKITHIPTSKPFGFGFRILQEDEVLQAFPVYGDFEMEYTDFGLLNWYV